MNDLTPIERDMIRWLPEYAVGVREIDEEHQRLFSLAAKLYWAIRDAKPVDILEKLLVDLVDYTGCHFAHEEELMVTIGYPHYRDHCRQHEELRARLQTIRQHWDSSETSVDTEVMRFLSDWLKCHTTTSDRRIGSYMRRQGMVP